MRIMRTLVFAMLSALVACWPQLSAYAWEPQRGSPVRTAILDSIRKPVERDLGPPVLLVVTAINVEGPWAFASVKAMRPNGPLDWSRTKFAKAMSNGAMSDSILVLLRGGDEQWRVVEYALGPTDVPWVEWVGKHRVAQRLFEDAYSPRRHSEPPPAPAGAAPPPSSAQTAAGWRKWSMGDLSFSTPSQWRNIDSPPAKPLRLGGEPWTATFADRLPTGEPHPTLVFSWKDDEYIYSRSLNDAQILGQGPQEFAGISGKRTFFRIKDRYNDFQGFDVVSSRPLRGGTFSVGCRAPRAGWPSIADTCERMLESVRLAARPQPDAAPPVADSRPQPPTVSVAPVPPPPVSAAPPIPQVQPVAPAGEITGNDAAKVAAIALASLETYEKSRNSQEWKTALAAAQKSVELDPRSAAYWRLLGRIYASGAAEMELATALAEEAFERSIALDPKVAETRMRLAALLSTRQAHAAAIDQVEAALMVAPELATWPTVSDLCRLYENDDQARRGVAFLGALSARHVKSHAALLGQARLLWLDDRKDEALLLAKKVADDPQTHKLEAEHARVLIADWQGRTP
jgi:tetratricopeptide (TPR) repeat protein